MNGRYLIDVYSICSSKNPNFVEINTSMVILVDNKNKIRTINSNMTAIRVAALSFSSIFIVVIFVPLFYYYTVLN